MPSKASVAITSEEATELFIEDRIEVRGTRDFRRRRVPSCKSRNSKAGTAVRQVLVQCISQDDR